MTLLIPCIYPIIWLLVAILMLLKWIFVDCWFIWAALGVIWLIYYIVKGIRFGFSSFGDTKKKKKAKNEFLEMLMQKSNLSMVNSKGKLDQRIASALSHIINHMSYDPQILLTFQKVYDEFINNLAVSNAVISTGKLNHNLDSVEGENLHVINKGWPRVDLSVKAFTIRWKNGRLYFYPFFCILETSEKIELIDWNTFSISSTKGNPSYHSYLHERVGGGPDRRYKFNPAIPVYLYSALVLNNAGKALNVILHGENEAEKIEKILRDYKKVLASTGGVSVDLDMNVIDYKEDEYASLFKSIINERGKDIVKEKLFISMLADYKVFREKRYLRAILVTMTEEGYWSELTEKNSSVETLEKIKQTIIAVHKFPKQEVNEAMSYIGYGLGIIA